MISDVYHGDYSRLIKQVAYSLLDKNGLTYDGAKKMDYEFLHHGFFG